MTRTTEELLKDTAAVAALGEEGTKGNWVNEELVALIAELAAELTAYMEAPKDKDKDRYHYGYRDGLESGRKEMGKAVAEYCAKQRDL